MIPRMTTVGTLKNYRYTLNGSNNTMTKAMDMVLTRRLFNSYAEDPALATRCFQIRNSFWKAQSQLDVNESLRHKYDVGWEALGNMSTDLYALAEDTALTSIIRGESDSTGPGRTALGQSLMAKAKDLTQIMNCRYGENYVFSGADTLNAPLTWEAQENPAYIDPQVAQAKLAEPGLTPEDEAKYEAPFKYMKKGNGVTNIEADADTEVLKNPEYDATTNPGVPKYLHKDTGEPTNNEADATVPRKNPNYDEAATFRYVKEDGTGTNNISESAKVLCYRGVPVDSNEAADTEKMEYFLHGEAKYVDVGLGHKEEGDGSAVSSTVFDSSLQGLYYLGGYGTKSVEVENADGTKTTVEDIPNNIISVVNEMGKILQRCDKSSGDFRPGTDDEVRLQALFQEFENSTSAFRERWTEMDTQSGFLRDNSELLTDTKDSLQQQYMELEDADPAAAISDFMFARYCYDAALKVGNSVLSQSLMDYMNF